MGTPLRVLLIEDNEDDAALIVRALERDGYELTWKRVDTPETMRDALQSETWDIALSDHTMPRFSGPQALALMEAAGHDLPFIIVSGSIGEEAAVDAMRAGARDYVLKDRLAKLPAAVARELRDAHARRAQVESEEKLREARERLDSAMQQLAHAEKMTALGELIAGVAHEINNPLSTIMGYAQLLQTRDLPPEIKKRLATMCSEAERMAKIVKNLLTFARKQPPEKKHLDLNEIIEKTLELKAYHFRVNQITVEKDLDPDLPNTMLDAQQMQQVFINLLNNAEQAMTEVKTGGTIRITTRTAHWGIEARIADDGPGIPREVQRRIFEPFFTTKKEKGTGLGLSLCYGIVNEHGGGIQVESEPGRGATFVIGLPVTREAVRSEARPAEPTSLTLPPLKVLVVDDEPGVQDLLADFLSARGHAVDTASDVPEALRKIAAADLDLIISDMKMPGGSGQDIYKALSGKSPHLAQRIVFTTGDGASTETRQFLIETGNACVAKPFSMEELERAIATAMRQ